MGFGRSRRGRDSYGYGYGGFAPYVPVAQRKAEAARQAKIAGKKGEKLEPVVIEGRTIAKTFWGKAFCDHLGRFASMSNRLDRGRTYVRNGSVFHLSVERCSVRALVSGSEVYEVSITMKPAPKERWKALTRACVGHIGSLVELLSGRFDDATMQKLVAPDAGLIPGDGELSYACSCPDGGGRLWVCKHVAAVMFGVGARLDHAPELLFKLRDVDPSELLAAVTTADLTRGKARPARTLATADLADVFGIELSGEPSATPAPRGKGARKAIKTPRSTEAAPKQASPRKIVAKSVAQPIAKRATKKVGPPVATVAAKMVAVPKTVATKKVVPLVATVAAKKRATPKTARSIALALTPPREPAKPRRSAS